MRRSALLRTAATTRRRRLLLAGAGVTATALLAMACRSTGTPPAEVEAFRSALAASAGGRTTDPAVIREGVDAFLSMFRTFRPEALRTAAADLYAEGAHFDDGFVRLDGVEAIADYLARSAEHVDGLEIDVDQVTIDDGEAYVRWQMRFAARDGGVVTDVPGISHLRFGADGRILYHRDYWDASGALADRIPALGRILRSIRSRL